MTLHASSKWEAVSVSLLGLEVKLLQPSGSSTGESIPDPLSVTTSRGSDLGAVSAPSPTLCLLEHSYPLCSSGFAIKQSREKPEPASLAALISGCYESCIHDRGVPNIIDPVRAKGPKSLRIKLNSELRNGIYTYM